MVNSINSMKIHIYVCRSPFESFYNRHNHFFSPSPLTTSNLSSSALFYCSSFNSSNVHSPHDHKMPTLNPIPSPSHQSSSNAHVPAQFSSHQPSPSYQPSSNYQIPARTPSQTMEVSNIVTAYKFRYYN